MSAPAAAPAAAAAPSASDRPEPSIKGIYLVLPYLYVGSADVAMNKDELKRLGVKYIINCASEDVDNFYPDDFTYTEFPIEDLHDAEPSEYFDAFYDIVAKVKEEKSMCFVHCTTGKNIAPTMILSYMLKSSKNQNKHLPLLQAYNFVTSKAPGSQPTDQFVQQLIDLEDELYGETSIRLKNSSRSFGEGASRRPSGRGGKGRGGKGKRGK